MKYLRNEKVFIAIYIYIYIYIYNNLSFKKHPKDNLYLDLLRCIAIFLVLLCHGYTVFIRHSLEEIDLPYEILMTNGYIGVDLFFVLSGYLIAGNLIRRRRQPFFLSSYLINRSLRILPTYYVVLALSVFVGSFSIYNIGKEDFGWKIFYHILMFQDYLPSDINLPFWSLGVEEKFYLMAPVVIYLGLRFWPLSAITIFPLLVLLPSLSRAIRYLSIETKDPWVFSHTIRSNFHFCLEPLVFGLFIALLEHHCKKKALGLGVLQAKWGLIILLFTGLFVMSYTPFQAEISLWNDAVFLPFLIALFFALAVFFSTALHEEKLPGELLFRIGARLSYSLYLVNWPIAACVKSFDPGKVSYWTLYLGISLGVALIIHFTVEKPFLVLRSFLNKKSRFHLSTRF